MVEVMKSELTFTKQVTRTVDEEFMLRVGFYGVGGVEHREPTDEEFDAFARANGYVKADEVSVDKELLDNLLRYQTAVSKLAELVDQPLNTAETIVDQFDGLVGTSGPVENLIEWKKEASELLRRYSDATQKLAATCGRPGKIGEGWVDILEELAKSGAHVSECRSAWNRVGEAVELDAATVSEVVNAVIAQRQRLTRVESENRALVEFLGDYGETMTAIMGASATKVDELANMSIEKRRRLSLCIAARNLLDVIRDDIDDEEERNSVHEDA